jgi:cellulose synthase/poly-beta-1,6-N-acetylglucosamine synthase-like glycosyltransferase
MFLTCVVALASTSVLLFVIGHRVRFASRIVGVLAAFAVTIGAGEAAAAWWDLPSRYVEVGQALLLVTMLVVVFARPLWNPIGQVFFGSYVASVITYLGAAAVITVTGGLAPLTMLASAALLVLEVVALLLSASFAFETCDVLCRSRWAREITPPDPNFLPKVSLQIAAYNEPPEMLIETIASVERMDYPDFEILVIDNNTKDPEVWQPVEQYCEGRPNVRFVHVDPWPGYKSGALNLALTDYTHPDAQVVGVIDADYIVDPTYLRSTVGYFADPKVGFVQTPQDYREWEGDAYLTACYDAYRYFFVTSMPSRNERNSIIFAGTMGLLRRSTLEGLGGWDEWCITEDAETSLRMLKAGHEGVFIPQAFGHGIMPLTFTALKSQRFRWCFGGMQILRRHWRELMPWDRDPENRLSIGQRLDYLTSGVQWLNDLVNLAFTVVLLAMAGVFLTNGQVSLRPLFGAALLLPAVLIASGLTRALWALRRATGITTKRAVLAFANWLSLSWTVAIACVQGLTRSEGVFMRTPKRSEDHHLLSALWAAKTESIIAAALWAAGIAVVVTGRANAFVGLLFAWQGSVYASSMATSWLNQHTELSAQLERRQRTELRRERLAALRPYYVGGAAASVACALIAVVVLVGGSQNPPRNDPFALPRAAPNDKGPLTNVIEGDAAGPSPLPANNATPTTTSSSDTTTTTVLTGGTSTSTSSDTTTTSDAPTTTASTTTTTTPPTTTTTVPPTTANATP